MTDLCISMQPLRRGCLFLLILVLPVLGIFLPAGTASAQRADIAMATDGGARSAALAPAAAGTPTDAAPAGRDLVVATRVLPPFVIEEEAGKYSGFSIDLWEAIATEAKLRTHLEAYRTLPELLDAVATGANPVGIAAVSITAQREEKLDFSQPMFRSGLQIMVPTGGSGLADTLRFVFSPVP